VALRSGVRAPREWDCGRRGAGRGLAPRARGEQRPGSAELA
jgi:hypothetical protein